MNPCEHGTNGWCPQCGIDRVAAQYVARFSVPGWVVADPAMPMLYAPRGPVRFAGSTSTSSGVDCPAPPPEPLPVESSTDLVVGYRRWNLRRRYPDGAKLTSYGASHVWPAYEPMVARCVYDDAHYAPAQRCDASHHTPGCGIYALRDGVDVDDDETNVVGSVYLWGRIIEHERGWRAQFAYPKELAVISGSAVIAAQLAETYGVPVVEWD